MGEGARSTLETSAGYLENTAGGDNAWPATSTPSPGCGTQIGDYGIGFCLDTCHARAAGEGLLEAVDRIKAITGRIDLVHCNDSKDAAGSGADRHDNLGHGQIDPSSSWPSSRRPTRR